MKLKITGLTDEKLYVVNELAPMLGIQLSDSEDNIENVTVYDDDKIIVKRKDGKGEIHSANMAQFCRALCLYADNASKKGIFSIEETPAYETLGVMIDCSRNAVLSQKAFEKAVRQLAVMGYNTIQLYTEDTYTIEGRPYFGYMRGRYTKEELKAFDSYAKKFGIELVPCVQTLAHLGQAIRWACMRPITDCNDILLVGEDETYRFIDDMFKSLSECFTSRNVNIGMDEAHMLGLGKYLDKNGYKDRSMIMVEHLKRVVEIAEKYGFKPMMWSDMFFRLAFGGDYYSADTSISDEVRKKVPENVSLVYWDYYSEKREMYDKMITRHLEFDNKIIFAGGAWRWNGFTPANEFSLHTSRLAAASCKENGIKDVLVTIWGDDGGETPLFSILPTLQFWAEDCYGENTDNDALTLRFKACVGASFADFMLMDLPSLTPDNPAPGRCAVNPSKYLFYQDVLMGLFDKHVQKGVYSEHYRKTADMLYGAAKRNPDWKYLFETQANLCEVLEIKSEVGIDLKAAYDSGDKEELSIIANETLPELLARVEDFYEAFRTQWNTENKIFGLDMSEIRIGGLKMRIEAAIRRINEYLKGQIKSIDELEQERLYFDCRNPDEDKPLSIGHNQWRTTSTASSQF